MNVSVEDMPKALAELESAENLSEAVVLSTCNRVEVYAFAERFHGGYHDVREFICRHTGLAPECIADHLYALHDTDAVAHLFAIAAGLDSAVIGEHEILGQVRSAWEQARQYGTVGSVLEPLFRHAVECGKRARTETAFGRGKPSVPRAAVALAHESLGGLHDRRVLIVGAGDMAEAVARSLMRFGAPKVMVTNRTSQRAERLAASIGGQAVPFKAIHSVLGTVDLVITTTGAPKDVLDRQALTGQELTIVDIAVPRDVDPAAAELAGIELFDMDTVKDFVKRSNHERQGVVADVESIVEQEVARYEAVASARAIAPLVAQLHERGDEIVAHELERFRARLVGLDPAERAAVEALARGVAKKLLRSPTVRVKAAAGKARGERLAEAVRDLFDL